MKHLILLNLSGCLLCGTIQVAAQVQNEPLEQQAQIWLRTVMLTESSPVMENVLTNQVQFPLDMDQNDWLNFHPFPRFQAHTDTEVRSLNFPRARGITAFGIYRPGVFQVEENIIWLAADTIPQLILTTHRGIRVHDKNFLNFVGQGTSTVKMLSYRTLLPSVSKAEHYQIKIGTFPDAYQLPMEPFSGQLSELLVFDRFLSNDECQVIETQLALRYGISLQPATPSRYITPNGTSLWTIAPDSRFHHNITGLGREDGWHFHQRQATNAGEPNFMIIWTGVLKTNNQDNRTKLPDHSYLLWGDDNRLLLLDSFQRIGPYRLQRNWRIEPNANFREVSTNLSLNTRALLSDLPYGMKWWLCVDQTGTGTYPISERQFHPIDELSRQGVATFQEMQWDQDQSGSDVFTLCAAPDFFAHWEINTPECAQNAKGKLNVRVVGGKLPFHYTLTSEQGYTNSAKLNDQQRIWKVDNLSSGKYYLSVKDHKGRIYSDTFWITDEDAPRIDLPTIQRLPENGRLVLQPMNMTNFPENIFTWTLPNAEKLTTPQITVTEPGWYQLEVDSAGCKSYWQGQIQPTAESLIKTAVLFPNPAQDGHFNLEVRLRKATDLNIGILQDDGRLIKQIKLRGHHYYQLQEHLSIKGNYRLQLTTKFDSQTLHLVVQ